MFWQVFEFVSHDLRGKNEKRNAEAQIFIQRAAKHLPLGLILILGRKILFQTAENFAADHPHTMVKFTLSKIKFADQIGKASEPKIFKFRRKWRFEKTGKPKRLPKGN